LYPLALLTLGPLLFIAGASLVFFVAFFPWVKRLAAQINDRLQIENPWARGGVYVAFGGLTAIFAMLATYIAGQMLGPWLFAGLRYQCWLA